MTSPRALTALRVAIAVVFIGGLVAFVVKGADNPPDPSLSAGPTASTASGSADGSADGRTPLPGFGETAVSVQTPGSLLEWCLLLAMTQEQRNQGLMNVTDTSLGGYDGMLFRFDKDTQVPFIMKNTVMPLSIAYIDSNGEVVSTTDMEPCPTETRCPFYQPGGRYRIAIEVPQGNLEKLGLTSDSIVTDTQTKCS